SEFNRIPMIHTYHTMYEDYVHYIANGRLVTPKMAQKLARLYCNRAQEVIAPSEKTKSYLTEIGVTRPINTVATGIDFAPFAKANFTKEQIVKTRAKFGIGEADPVIVTVGRVAQEKGLDLLVRQMPEILREMPDAKLLIVGDGPARAGLEELAGHIGVRASVVFAGAVPPDAVPLYYQLGNVFATASITESQGLTYIEAIAGGVPVVVKRDRSLENVVIHGKTGFCFERDAEAARTLLHALSHPDEAAACAERAIQAIGHLSSERFAKNVEAIYIRAIAERNARKGMRTVRIRRGVGRIKGRISAGSGKVRGTLRAGGGRVKGTLRAGSGKVRGTLRAGSGKVRAVVGRRR
ncbi:MAG: glycosyltransferase, partial [Firmicutes bacterium]|nr:glycosyltransferase [Bacillota bacterium]